MANNTEPRWASDKDSDSSDDILKQAMKERSLTESTQQHGGDASTASPVGTDVKWESLGYQVGLPANKSTGFTKELHPQATDPNPVDKGKDPELHLFPSDMSQEQEDNNQSKKQLKGKGKQIFPEDDEPDEELMFESLEGTHKSVLAEIQEAAKNPQPKAIIPTDSLTDQSEPLKFEDNLFDDDDSGLQRAIQESLQGSNNRAGESSAAGAATGSHFFTGDLQEDRQEPPVTKEGFSKLDPREQLKVCLSLHDFWKTHKDFTHLWPDVSTVMRSNEIPRDCDPGTLWDQLTILRDAHANLT